MARLQDYKGQVTKALRAAGVYSQALSIQINSLASALLTLSIANAEIEKLDSVLLKSTTTQGTTTAMHPAFKVQRDAMDQITRQMKQLGLTTADVVGKPDIPDGCDEVYEKISSIN